MISLGVVVRGERESCERELRERVARESCEKSVFEVGVLKVGEELRKDAGLTCLYRRPSWHAMSRGNCLTGIRIIVSCCKRVVRSTANNAGGGVNHSCFEFGPVLISEWREDIFVKALFLTEWF